MSLYQNHTDRDLLLLLQQNDSNAFAELYDRHAPKVRSIAYSKTNSIDGAQEIVQETFMRLWERRSSLVIDNLPNYLAIAVKYQVINYVKKKVTVEKHNEFYRTFAKISAEETLQAVELKNLYEELEKGISRLPEKTQVVFRLNRLEHKSIAEISEKLNLSQKAIKYHITRSLKELKFYLREFIISISVILILLVESH
ncbi:MAG TPA: sigma-70 family RNA polymerase sigma factor [Cyclobacteriaceae bacterium]